MVSVLGFDFVGVPLDVSNEEIVERSRKLFGVTAVDMVRKGSVVTVGYSPATSRMQKEITSLAPPSTVKW